ncbi:alpha/beta fold hydrolase [Streptomyces syringium]|uniref:Pimeloyl-ACP methyl ester carboxylesterase n=1 Tax=Streptomyces syringium TaxID=76729 RepID=A0ABS4YCM2_9ACTN|nr:alpha/beta fold hydrolase [Streptomyces syringium]MBP2406182.1 pimeloyl-ACP methyl ester carboxylesterase [Streptomyces syringium]
MSEEIVRSLTVDGMRYAYRVLPRPEPVTEPVVVFGGALQGMFGWPQMEDRLGPVADLVTADLPGMGSGAVCPADAGIEVLHTAVARIIEDLGVPRVNLFGYSFGAILAFRQAQRYPDRIARLVLGGMPSTLTDAQHDGLRQVAEILAAGRAEDFATRVADAMICRDEDRVVRHRQLVHRYVRRSLLHVARHSPHAAHALGRTLANRLDLGGGLTGVPTLSFAGEHDTVVPPAAQRAFATTIEDSRFAVIAESDHWVIMERAAEVADLTWRFFTDQPLHSAPYLAEPLSRRGAALVRRATAGGTPSFS